MVIPHLRIYCLALLCSLPFLAQAEIYKWTDKNGQVHYTQQPPVDRPAEHIAPPPPPAIDPEKAQQQLDELIESQEAEAAAEAEQQKAAQAAEEAEQIREQNCQTARNNLQQYQDNPGRRVMNADGEVTRPTEEERQAKIAEFQQQVDEFCN
ncbi:MAG: DUF4124 domain-containing protein [Methylophaga sp.]